MKLVLNVCYGGFGLSSEAKALYMSKYKEKKNLNDFKLSVIKCKYGSKRSTVFLIKNDIIIDNVENLYKLNDNDYIIFYDHDFERDDPLLIDTIEELGLKESSGECAELNIIDIPKGTLYRIDEYDGREHIEYANDVDWKISN